MVKAPGILSAWAALGPKCLVDDFEFKQKVWCMRGGREERPVLLGSGETARESSHCVTSAHGGLEGRSWLARVSFSP
ncbi:hypothetical protein E2C01_022330 [Portunus trituberculatus]|uniref:Uncharacterized protein n=1 Tax=Portunus trituberculatus TaxID=210409 RepID=A0A5B7E7E4_PORTR|nr:hypothetical protein [Portunus trituberculatus]